MRKLILYISCSLDGFIAKPGDDLSFLSMVQKEGEDYGYSGFVKTVDTVIVGRRTYDWVVGQGYNFPHSDKESYILTRKEIPAQGNLRFYNGDIKTLVNNLKRKRGKNIFCDGDAKVVNELLKHNLIDEIILSIVPILLGSGIRLFKEQQIEKKLTFISSKAYETGLVQLHYKRINSKK